MGRTVRTVTATTITMGRKVPEVGDVLEAPEWRQSGWLIVIDVRKEYFGSNTNIQYQIVYQGYKDTDDDVPEHLRGRRMSGYTVALSRLGSYLIVKKLSPEECLTHGHRNVRALGLRIDD